MDAGTAGGPTAERPPHIPAAPPPETPAAPPPEFPPAPPPDVPPPHVPAAPAPQIPPGAGPMFDWTPAAAAPPAARPVRWDGVSVTALALAIPGLVVAAIPLAITGLARTRGKARRGRGLAIAGLALSWLWTVLLATVAGAAMMLVAQDQAPPPDSSAAAAGVPLVQPQPTPTASQPPSVVASPSPRPPAAPPVRPKKVRVKNLRPGHCVDREPTKVFETLPVVPCAQSHAVEIYAIPNLGRGKWPGETAIYDRAENACRAAFEAYVGVPYDESTLEIGGSAPTQDSWRAGDRNAICILRDPAGRLVGTMKGRAL
ncbi:MAG TPA: septum formation family protein [Pilimelia sp.]|nr:septum formation family protein [Pilimelia sp.]